MKIGIIGRTHLLFNTAKMLSESGHEIVFIYTCKSEEFYSKKEDDFKALAEELGCPFFCDLNIEKRIEEIKKYNADVCISINWLSILKNKTLHAFKYGIINAHCGDLPRYRGNACPNWAILNFEAHVALTIHKMIEDLDAGPIYKKFYLDIDETTYIGDIYNWLDEVIPKGFLEVVNMLKDSPPIPQDSNIKALRAYPRKPEDSKISFNSDTKDILALIRASSKPFSGAYCELNRNEKIFIYKASEYKPDFEFSAIPGQLCLICEDTRLPVIATKNGMIKIEESVTEDGQDASKKILSSMRNRLC